MQLHAGYSAECLYLAGADKQRLASFGDWEKDRLRIIVRSAGAASEGNPEDGEDQETVEAAEQIGLNLPADKEKVKGEYRPTFLTGNAITLSDGVQVIVRFFGDPEKIHQNYDYEHCKGYWTSWDRDLVLPPTTLRAIVDRRLNYTGSLYPVCSLFRMRKFLQRGWKVDAGQILKMAIQISNLNLSDINTLEDQLIGVDVAYFNRLIDVIKEKAGQSPHIESCYVVELINEVFQ